MEPLEKSVGVGVFKIVRGGKTTRLNLTIVYFGYEVNQKFKTVTMTRVQPIDPVGLGTNEDGPIPVTHERIRRR